MATVKTTIPGVFYRKPSPAEPNCVETGDTVEEGQVIGLVEVMKNFNELKSTAAGTVKEFLVENEGEVGVGDDIAVIE